jgi:hypothetical protein
MRLIVLQTAVVSARCNCFRLCNDAGVECYSNANMGSSNVCTTVYSAYQTVVHSTVLRHTGWHDRKYCYNANFINLFTIIRDYL